LRELKIEVDCKDAGTSECYVSDTRWYYSDTNSTENGLEIIDIEKDGFEYVLKGLNYSEETEWSSINLGGDVFTTLKFDLANGLKNYKEESNSHIDQPIPEEEAPQTGNIFGFASIGALSILGYVGAKLIK